MAGRHSKPRVLPPGTSDLRWWALPFLCLAQIIVASDPLAITVALPKLAEGVSVTDPAHLMWFVSAFVVCFAGFTLYAGSIADRFGRRRTLLGGLAVFASASWLASVSGSSGSLMAARALTGIGAAAIFPATLAIITDLFKDRHERRLAVAAWTAASGVAAVTGPMLGGWVITRWDWGWLFSMNVPLCLIAGVGVGLTVSESVDPRRHKLDLVGAWIGSNVVVVAAATVIEAPSRGFTDPLILGGVVTVVGLAVGFFWWEGRHPNPLVDRRLMRAKRFRATNLVLFASQAAVFGFMALTVQHLGVIFALSPARVGVMLIPFAAAVTFGAYRSAIVVDQYGYRATVAAGLAMSAAGAFLVAGHRSDAKLFPLVVGMVAIGSGVGVTVSTATESMLGSFPGRIAGVGSAVNASFRQLGAAVGIAVGGSFASNEFSSGVRSGLGTGGFMPQFVIDAAAQSLASARFVADAAASTMGPGAGDKIRSVATESFLSANKSSMKILALVVIWAVVIAVWALPGQDPALNRKPRRDIDEPPPKQSRRAARSATAAAGESGSMDPTRIDDQFPTEPKTIKDVESDPFDLNDLRDSDDMFLEPVG